MAMLLAVAVIRPVRSVADGADWWLYTTLTPEKPAMAEHDLVALWEAHCRYEFETRDVDATMATMVADPYVNHIPTMTGGVGHDQLRRFYKYHFIGANPADMALSPISRTVGTDRIVDEMVLSYTHTTEIDWMLPGIPPTGRKVEIPLVAIIHFRDGKLAHEHIYWDQASVLVQIGKLDPPYAFVRAESSFNKAEYLKCHFACREQARLQHDEPLAAGQGAEGMCRSVRARPRGARALADSVRGDPGSLASHDRAEREPLSGIGR